MSKVYDANERLNKSRLEDCEVVLHTDNWFTKALENGGEIPVCKKCGQSFDFCTIKNDYVHTCEE